MLQQGDKIAIVAPARKLAPEDIQPGLEMLKNWGYEPVYGKNLFNAHNQFSGTDQERAADLNSAIADPEVKAIICARGGYGCIRIVDAIDFSPLKKNFKYVFGYSDITVFHNHILAQYGLPSVHSTMPVNMGKNSAEAITGLQSILKGELPEYSINTHPLNINGTAEGILYGGNLSLLFALNGSPSLPDPRGKILFIEDLDEYIYHIDRIMINLERSGILQSISGLIIGGFTQMKDNPVPYGKTAYQVIHEHVNTLGIPVCFDFPAGHIDDNRPLIIGKKIKLEVSDKRSFISFR
jgi:muramoyltetrapeptide carboxypeptidase